MFVVLLTRLMQSKTSKFAAGFLNFLSFLFTLNKPGLDMDQIVAVVDSIQPGANLFGGMMDGALIPELTKLSVPSERLQCAIGLSRLLTCSSLLNQNFTTWPKLLNALLDLLLQSSLLVEKKEDEDDDVDLEQGYQASFSRLATVATQSTAMALPEDAALFLCQCITPLFKDARVVAAVQGLGEEKARFISETMARGGLV